jgi:hypothetical protein
VSDTLTSTASPVVGDIDGDLAFVAGFDIGESVVHEVGDGGLDQPGGACDDRTRSRADGDVSTDLLGHGAHVGRYLFRGIGHGGAPCRKPRPTTSPSSERSMPYAAGRRGRPGMVAMQKPGHFYLALT